VTGIGIYKREFFIDFWQKNLLSKMSEIRPAFLILSLVLFIFGSALVLRSRQHAGRRRKNTGFSMIRRVPASKKVFPVIIGLLLVFLTSPLLVEAVKFVYSKLA
jgi:hypothetical protein